MKKRATTRREFLQVAGAGIGAGSLLLNSKAGATLVAQGQSGQRTAASVGDCRLMIEFDSQLRSRLWHLQDAGHQDGVALTRWSGSESVLLADGSRVDRFALREQARADIEGPLGSGTRLRMVGVSESQLEKTLEVDMFQRYPGMAFLRASYRNLGRQAVEVIAWRNSEMLLASPSAGGAAVGGGAADGGECAPTGDAPVATRADVVSAAPSSGTPDPPFWAYCGSTHPDRRDWVRRVKPGFSQANFMGMNGSDYGGGTPIVDIWRKDVGVAVGHIELTPRLVSIPLTCSKAGAKLSISAKLHNTTPSDGPPLADRGKVLQPGEQFNTDQTFVATHTGDYFSVVDSYRGIMADHGMKSPPAPKSAFEPIWCAWGYERECTTKLIEDTLPKVRELGLHWAVIDDGWQNNVGDWKLDPKKYPRGEADMKGLVQSIRSCDLEPRLWWAPLAAVPGSDLVHDHTDMLLLDQDGAPQNVSWWNSLYLCPAYDKTVEYSTALVRKFIGEWGYAGLKIDGQHLNGVAPCFNPAHHHARPEESVEKLQDFFQAIYQAALHSNPQACVELCPCGTSYSFFNFSAFNQAPASDPESSWQVRHKGKTLKALMGHGASFAGDHVELSDGGDDFASTVGIGAVISTKFTWPLDPKPKDSFLLTPEREAVWRKWIALYNERQLPQGTYRGELYDIGFDHPETHVIQKSGRLYYAFYASHFDGPVPLRGLGDGRYRVRDYFGDRDLGEVSSGHNTLQVAFKQFLVLEAVPA